MTVSTATDLKRMVNQLQNERTNLVRQIEEIDATFTELGITSNTSKKRRGRQPGPKKVGVAKRGPKPGKKSDKKIIHKRGRKKRRSFAISGDESVLKFIKSSDNPTTAQINAHWTREGRGGKADATISKLVKIKKLKRTNIKGKRGSQYKTA